MNFFLLLAVVAHAAYGGNVGVRTSNLLSPADVTYVDGSYHAGLAAGPVAYSASVSQPVYQPVHAGVAAAPAVAVAPQSFAAPVAYAAPAAKYAAIPTVQHVQGVADVPVTRIDAQPALIQKTVDVARPAVKTQRYEVRRPAIQKQFYDVEERVVVRPAGSAVVELDEPLSRTQKGPSVIQPTGEGVAVSSSAAVAVPAAPVAVPAAPVAVPAAPVAVPAAPAVAPAPAELPSVEINLARTSLPSFGIARTAQTAVAPSVGLARASFAAAPAPAPSAALPAPAPAAFPSVTFARTAAPAPVPSVEVRHTFQAPVGYSAPAVGISSVPIKTVSAPINTISGVSAISSGVSGIAAGPSHEYFSTPAPQYQQQIVQTTPAPQLSDDSVAIDSADFSLARSGGQARAYTAAQTYSAAAQTYSAAAQTYSAAAPAPAAQVRTAQPAPAPRSSLVVNYPNPVDLIPQSRFSSAAVYSEPNHQSYINQDNQQKLIQLVTARGGVNEIGFGRSGPASYPQEAGQVRARVLSATPAPAYAAPTGERVNTRRIVVSRPIETLQEVEVAEPVTKYERVQVQQPAVVKTASQDVVRVATSVPVYGKTLAPISAYSADWH